MHPDTKYGILIVSYYEDCGPAELKTARKYIYTLKEINKMYHLSPKLNVDYAIYEDSCYVPDEEDSMIHHGKVVYYFMRLGPWAVINGFLTHDALELLRILKNDKRPFFLYQPNGIGKIERIVH